VLLVLALLGLLAPARALAGEQTLVFRSQPVTLGPYAVEQSYQLVPSPKVDGYVVGISADLVDQNGVSEPISHVMLHHIVFAKLGTPDTTCSQIRDYDGRRVNFPAERFYAEGEERTAIEFPAGYGYPNRGTDLWGMLFMLMNHRKVTETVSVQYTVRYVTDSPLRPVTPIWLDVENCKADPIFDVPGTGPLFSTFSRHSDFRMPVGGYLVAGGAHLHGGGLRLELSDRTCGRSLFTAAPTWGLPLIRPVMHEPGPKHMTTFSIPDGIPVAAGDVLRLNAVYDDSLPHTRTMGIMLVFLAQAPVTGCPAVPSLPADPLSSPGAPPRIRLPLLVQPKGPFVRDPFNAWVGDYLFNAGRVSISRGTTFRWRFAGPSAHNVTLASGPVGFSSQSSVGGTFRYRFTRPGVYKLFCSLHPARMTQIVRVR
jgi:hypothetical protein